MPFIFLFSFPLRFKSCSFLSFLHLPLIYISILVASFRLFCVSKKKKKEKRTAYNLNYNSMVEVKGINPIKLNTDQHFALRF